jgi:hypothetical protein
MSKKEKAKAINAVLRKESNTFDGYFKYEVTIENEDGTTEVVPAYGKDLQDALSRVVHDRKIEKILPKVSRVPEAVWVLIWFIILGVNMAYTMTLTGLFGKYIGLAYIGVMACTVALSLVISNYFTLKNQPKR